MSANGKQGKPILCLDFDGVVHSYSSGWQGAATINDPPVPGAMQFIIDAMQSFQVSIFSSRSHQSGGLGAMQGYVLAHMRRHLIDAGLSTSEAATEHARKLYWAIQWPREKPSAFISIDDRALTFTGQWPAIESLINFKPWNKKSDTPAVAPAEPPWRFYRSKPSQIMAWQYNGDPLSPGVCCCDHKLPHLKSAPHVHTMHGSLNLSLGDWIVPEPVDGLFYLIKPEVFAKKYEAI